MGRNLTEPSQRRRGHGGGPFPGVGAVIIAARFGPFGLDEAGRAQITMTQHQRHVRAPGVKPMRRPILLPVNGRAQHRGQPSHGENDNRTETEPTGNHPIYPLGTL